ncbi:hypothetical protein SCHPADRAFT_936160 [Schizopora paradoxa]|uniref:Uncharacterized protein n=1 Tax=Schizopora paradoxa TaxID=27342 RepID=A0A0H2SN41_9AGAM|nr:hypothetical protein SCHPADRAFT_936160 [Schizopora paradoxa]
MSPNATFELIRTDSIDSNATAPNLPGPGRIVGLLFDWLGERLEREIRNRVRNIGYDPFKVAQDVRRLCRHDERGIIERHKHSNFELSDIDRRKLVKSCKKLLACMRSKVSSTQLAALDEMIDLTIEDPLIRTTLAECDLSGLLPKYKEPDLIISTIKALGSIQYARIHGIWSDVIQVSCNKTDEELYPTLKSIRESLFTSLRHPEVSFLAARYLAHVLRLALPPGERFWVANALQHLCSELWQFYMDIAGETSKGIEWPTFDSCICGFDQLIFYDPEGHVDQTGRRRLPSLARIFIRNLQDTQIFENLLRAPSIEYVVEDETIAITEVSNWNLDARWCRSLCAAFLQELSGTEDAQVQLAFVRGGMDAGTRRRLKLTVLISEACIIYCQLTHIYRSLNAIELEELHTALLDDDSPTSRSQYSTSSKLTFWTDKLMSTFADAKTVDAKALAKCLIARFMSIDRYCKYAIQKTTKYSSDWTRFYFPPRVLKYLNDVEGGYFRHCRGRCLVRLKTNNKIHIVDAEWDMDLAKLLRRYGSEHLTIDVMFIGENMAMYHHLTGDQPFDPNGHYPLLAGKDASSGEPLFVADYHRNPHYFFAAVAAGQTLVENEEPDGNIYTTTHICVLCLRHDPSDVRAPFPSIPKDAMDATGPLHWLAFWPEKDPEISRDLSIQHKFDRLDAVLATLLKTSNSCDTERVRSDMLHRATRRVNLEGSPFHESQREEFVSKRCCGETDGIAEEPVEFSLSADSNSDFESGCYTDWDDSTLNSENSGQESPLLSLANEFPEETMFMKKDASDASDICGNFTEDDAHAWGTCNEIRIQVLEEELRSTQILVAKQQSELHRMRALITTSQQGHSTTGGRSSSE